MSTPARYAVTLPAGQYEEWRITGDAPGYGPYLTVFTSEEDLWRFLDHADEFRRNVTNVKVEQRTVTVGEWSPAERAVE